MSGIEPWIVWSNEHRAFWGPNHCGYTGRIEKAGRYTKAEAEAICNGANYRANSTIYEGTPPEICMPAPEALHDQSERVSRLEEALRHIACGATHSKALFESKMRGRKSLTWHAVNELQDYLEAAQGTARSALNQDSSNG